MGMLVCLDAALPTLFFLLEVLAKVRLSWVLSILIGSPPVSLYLRQCLPQLAFSLARLPVFSPAIFLPPVVVAEGGPSVSHKLLDQALSEVDVLQVSQ